MAKTDISEWRELILQTARDIGNQFTDPEDDWSPTALIANEEKAGVIPLQEVFADDAGKDDLAGILAEVFRQFKPKAAALVFSGYFATLQQRQRYAHLKRIKDIPGRQEILAIHIVTCDGHEEVWKATILRYKDLPPQLEAWEAMPQDAC